MALPLHMEVHDACLAEADWIEDDAFAGARAEDGGALLCESDVLRREGLRGKRPSFAVDVGDDVRVWVYVYRSTHAVMHVAVCSEEALVLVFRPRARPIDDTDADATARQRLTDWWKRHGGLRETA